MEKGKEVSEGRREGRKERRKEGRRRKERWKSEWLALTEFGRDFIRSDGI